MYREMRIFKFNLFMKSFPLHISVDALATANSLGKANEKLRVGVTCTSSADCISPCRTLCPITNAALCYNGNCACRARN